MEGILIGKFYATKGQTKLNWLFQQMFPPKDKQTNSTTTMIPQVNLFLFSFWRKLKTPKRHFEINWPLSNVKTKWKKKLLISEAFSEDMNFMLLLSNFLYTFCPLNNQVFFVSNDQVHSLYLFLYPICGSNHNCFLYKQR